MQVRHLIVVLQLNLWLSDAEKQRVNLIARLQIKLKFVILCPVTCCALTSDYLVRVEPSDTAGLVLVL